MRTDTAEDATLSNHGVAALPGNAIVNAADDSR